MKDKLHILQHSLGLDGYGEGRQHRNYFVTGAGCTDFDLCVSLVADGLMTQTVGNAITGGDDVFRATPAGIDYVAMNSPDKPKLTRGQKNYQRWLDADGCQSFAEFMGFKGR